MAVHLHPTLSCQDFTTSCLQTPLSAFDSTSPSSTNGSLHTASQVLPLYNSLLSAECKILTEHLRGILCVYSLETCQFLKSRYRSIALPICFLFPDTPFLRTGPALSRVMGMCASVLSLCRASLKASHALTSLSAVNFTVPPESLQPLTKLVVFPVCGNPLCRLD